jgi:hypothetical protein
MRFSVLAVFWLIATSTGCGANVSGADCSGGTLDGDHCVQYSPDERVAQLVEATALDESKPFTDVTCHVAGSLVAGAVAQCSGKAADGKTVRATFRVVETQPLVPLCPSPAHPNRPRGPFCAGG